MLPNTLECKMWVFFFFLEKKGYNFYIYISYIGKAANNKWYTTGRETFPKN